MGEPEDHHDVAVASFDGGTLDCGSGLLLRIRQHIDPLRPGQILELISRESSVLEDLPAWCRLTNNPLVKSEPLVDGKGHRFWIRKAAAGDSHSGASAPPITGSSTAITARTTPTSSPTMPHRVVTDQATAIIPPLAVMGVGSWPRPPWLLSALHAYLAHQLDEEQFTSLANDSVDLILQAQQRAGVDVYTDGEQRRLDYASFVGRRLDNCQLIPLTDLLPYVEHPEQFAAALQQLDVPADKVRHPAVWGRIQRSQPLTLPELTYVQARLAAPVKVALPGPYLLTRTMWMECISDRAYASREELAADIVRVLREEIADLLTSGAALVQLDEPVLTEAVYGRPTSGSRSFMCGALGHKAPVAQELVFAEDLLQQTLAGFPRERLALHICRGNWTTDERAALSGDYQPLVPLLAALPVGTLFLELCTPRAGDWEILSQLPTSMRVGVGVINQKDPQVESIETLLDRAERAIRLWGPERVLLNPDCGFATFADNPLSSRSVAEAKLANLVQAARRLRDRYL